MDNVKLCQGSEPSQGCVNYICGWIYIETNSNEICYDSEDGLWVLFNRQHFPCFHKAIHIQPVQEYSARYPLTIFVCAVPL